MSDQVQIPDWVVFRVGVLTLQLEDAQRRVAELERENVALCPQESSPDATN